jgi:processive 1,2-diacylglycerol beta-glucosyltransferase/1,2-diacylglycerol 3-beta-galactosyltransferase
MGKKKNKYLFLYLKTGGGHLAPARSLADYLKHNYNESVETILVDGFSKTNGLVRYIIEDGYRISQTKAPWIYETLYALYKIPFVSELNNYLLSLFIYPYLKETINKEKPEKILIFHFFLIRPVYRLIKKEKLKCSAYTIVTDPFTAHPIWFLNKNQNFILFSEKLRKRCIDNGIPAKNINVLPFIIAEKFSGKRDGVNMPEIKKKLGFSTDSKVILLLGGGEGIPKGEMIVRQLISNINNIEIAVVCGRNKNLFNNLSHYVDQGGIANIKLFGYIDFVEELINASDVVITKCGASTFMEILFCKKIPIVISYIWEQEKGNVEFLTENNLGVYEKRIEKLPEIIKGIFSDEEKYSGIKRNISERNFENGVEKVAEFIVIN